MLLLPLLLLPLLLFSILRTGHLSTPLALIVRLSLVWLLLPPVRCRLLLLWVPRMLQGMLLPSAWHHLLRHLGMLLLM
jgi:hypothetical protein